jgi:hypothetical protein
MRVCVCVCWCWTRPIALDRYYYNGEYENTLHIYLRLRRGDVFGLIQSKRLVRAVCCYVSELCYHPLTTSLYAQHAAVRDRVKLLCEFDLTRAIALLVDSVEQLPIAVVVDQVMNLIALARALTLAHCSSLARAPCCTPTCTRCSCATRTSPRTTTRCR